MNSVCCDYTAALLPDSRCTVMRCGNPGGQRRHDSPFNSCYSHCWGSSRGRSCWHFLFVRCGRCMFPLRCTGLLDSSTIFLLLIPRDKRYQEEPARAHARCFSWRERRYTKTRPCIFGRSGPFPDSRLIPAEPSRRRAQVRFTDVVFGQSSIINFMTHHAQWSIAVAVDDSWGWYRGGDRAARERLRKMTSSPPRLTVPCVPCGSLPPGSWPPQGSPGWGVPPSHKADGESGSITLTCTSRSERDKSVITNSICRLPQANLCMKWLTPADAPESSEGASALFSAQTDAFILGPVYHTR